MFWAFACATRFAQLKGWGGLRCWQRVVEREVIGVHGRVDVDVSWGLRARYFRVKVLGIWCQKVGTSKGVRKIVTAMGGLEDLFQS